LVAIAGLAAMLIVTVTVALTQPWGERGKLDDNSLRALGDSDLHRKATSKAMSSSATVREETGHRKAENVREDSAKDDGLPLLKGIRADEDGPSKAKKSALNPLAPQQDS